MADYLKRRGEHFYFRLRIPRDLLPFFNGRREIKKSLKTAKHITARGLVRLHLGRAETLFAKIRSGLMTGEEIRKLAADYFDRTLAETEEDSTGGIVTRLIDYDENGEHGVSSVDVLELHLSDMMENLARDQHETVAHLADHILEEAGLTIEKTSHEYRQLCREVLKGAIDGTKVDIERMKGNYSSLPSPLPASTVVPKPKDDGELLSRLITEFSHECSSGGRWRGRTRKEAEGCLSLLLQIVGDRGIKTITRKDLVGFRDALLKWPSNATKAKKYKGLTAQEVLALADAESAARPLSTTTVNKYLVFAGALFRWAVANGHTETSYADGLSIPKRAVKGSEEKEAYDTEDLLRLVRSPLLQFRKTRPERFFIPWIGAYSGMRLAEISQIHLSDIKKIDSSEGSAGIPCFDVNDTGDKALKNVSSRRIVPIHPLLIELGLMEYVEELRAKGGPRLSASARLAASARLWPNLKRTQTGYGQDFGRWFQRWNRQHITDHPKKSFHSLRHSFS
jgi:integrase